MLASFTLQNYKENIEIQNYYKIFGFNSQNITSFLDFTLIYTLVGAYGPEVQRKAEWLLDWGMYDYCGTDMHSIEQMRMFLNSEISKKKVKKVKLISDCQVL